jgi:uncharacterized protein YjiS (DUF1127 family)
MPAVLAKLLHFARAARNRRQIVPLSKLDDHLLRDIGLQRTDILAALAQPLHRDPSHVLKALCCRSGLLIKHLRDATAPQPILCC